MRTLSCVLALLIAPAVHQALAAQEVLEEAKSQYSAAAYEEALSTLARAAEAPPINRVELEQYRAFCLIALGRTADAERAIASLVAADPIYVPSRSVASPKVLAIVADMRKKELPAVARRLLDEGRIAFKEKEFSRAQQNFDVLRKILDDDAMKDRPETEDLRVLADGFAALSVAVVAPGADARVSAGPQLVYADTMVEAVPVQQDVPVWIPPNAVAGAREYTGAIKVRIGIDGRVKSASIERPTYPSYDARLLYSSRQWIYRPATRNGQAIESEKVIPVRLSPRG